MKKVFSILLLLSIGTLFCYSLHITDSDTCPICGGTGVYLGEFWDSGDGTPGHDHMYLREYKCSNPACEYTFYNIIHEHNQVYDPSYEGNEYESISDSEHKMMERRLMKWVGTIQLIDAVCAIMLTLKIPERQM